MKLFGCLIWPSEDLRIFHMPQSTGFVSKGTENWGGRRKCCLPVFSPFSTIFSKAFLFRSLKHYALYDEMLYFIYKNIFKVIGCWFCFRRHVKKTFSDLCTTAVGFSVQSINFM